MSKRNLGSKIKLSSYDDMFGVNVAENENVNEENQIKDVALSELHPFKNHQGVDLAFIPKEEQDVVFCVMQKTGVYINMEQSARIKNAVKEGLFNEQWLLEILSYKKPPVRKVVFNQNKLDSYFEPNMTNEDIEGVIVKLLEEWKMKGGQV